MARATTRKLNQAANHWRTTTSAWSQKVWAIIVLLGASAAIAQTSTTQPTSQTTTMPAIPDGSTDYDPTTLKPRTPITPPKADEADVPSFGILNFANFTFDPEKSKDIPKDIKAWDGKKIRLRGFIIPFTQSATITDFALVPTLGSCCFGQPPGVQHVIVSRVANGGKMTFMPDEVWCEGIIHVDLKREDGYTFQVFRFDVTSAKLAGR